MDASAYLRLTLDPSRLAVLGALAAGGGTADEIAERARQDRRTGLSVLATLVQSGLARVAEQRYELDTVALRAIAQDLPGPPPPHPRVGFGMTTEEQVILSRFFQGERLVEIPATRAKRLVVLERLALDFDPGSRYPEAEVNRRLACYHDDFAALRRLLVDEGFLDREGGKYWRSGGRMA